MNPFEEQEENNTNTKVSNVEIWLEINGKRKNTYISGLPYDEDVLKEHLKNLKKKHGCNGSYKELSVEGQIKEVLQLQGDHIDNVQSYLKSINITNFTIRDFQSK
jgi:translation initiation factor 1 (eIF-1/SUI1)